MSISQEQIDFMHADLESDFGYTKIIESVKERFKKEGRDFEKEFEDSQNPAYDGALWAFLKIIKENKQH